MRTFFRAVGSRRGLLALFLILGGILPPSRGTAEETPAPPGSRPKDLTSVLTQIRDRFRIPAVTAAVCRDGEIVAVGAVGVRSSAGSDPVSVDDRFLIGSCAKSMLRVLIARLADEGRISFDTQLGSALPDVPMREEYRNVTISQILAFKGGIQPYTDRIGPKLTPWLFELKGTPVEQRAAFTAHVLNEPPVAPPGTREVYSNAAYAIVAHVAERLVGRPWEDLVAEEVFRPLAMSSPIIGLPSSDRPDAPQGHFHNKDGYSPAPPHPILSAIAPAGLVSCSVSDFARFAGELAMIEEGKAGRFLTPESAAKVASLVPGGALREGTPFLGGEGTFTAAFATWPSHGIGIVVQTNGGDSDEVCTAALDAVRADIAPDLPPPVPPSGRRFGVSMAERNGDVEVREVAPGSRAARAGIQPGDVLVRINGTPVERMGMTEQRDALGADSVRVTVRRAGKEIDLSVSGE